MKRTMAFWVCLATSVGLFVGGFFVPPIGVIDGSLLKGVGLLLGFSIVEQLPKVIKEVKEVGAAKISKGDLSIEIGKNNE